MRSIFAFIFLITLSTNSFGQISNEKEIYGTWKVDKIIEPPTSPQFRSLVEGFRNSTFTFYQNGNFDLTTTSNSELFGMVTEMTNGSKWKFDKNKQHVKIGTKEDGYSTMEISIKEINGSKIFQLIESEMTLEMKKVE